MRALGRFEVSAVSLGCMSLSHAYGHPPAEGDASRLLNQALDVGYTMLDTAALYGFGANETLVGKVHSLVEGVNLEWHCDLLDILVSVSVVWVIEGNNRTGWIVYYTCDHEVIAGNCV